MNMIPNNANSNVRQTKKYSFNVNANFKPRQVYVTQSVSTQQDPPPFLPSKIPLSTSVKNSHPSSLQITSSQLVYFQQPATESSSHLAHFPVEMPSLPLSQEPKVDGEEYCSCPTRLVEVSAQDYGMTRHLVDLARSLYDVESESTLPNRPASVRFFDYRSPESFRDFLLKHYLGRGYDIEVTAIHEDKDIAISFDIPWLAKVTQDEIARRMAQVGDLSLLKFEQTALGRVSRVLCQYHDARALATALTGPLEFSGVSVMPRITVASDPVWSSTKKAHYTRKVIFVDKPNTLQDRLAPNPPISEMGLTKEPIRSTPFSYHTQHPLKFALGESKHPQNEFYRHKAVNMPPSNSKRMDYATKSPPPPLITSGAMPKNAPSDGYGTLQALESNFKNTAASSPYSISHYSDFSAGETYKSLGSVSSIESVSTTASLGSAEEKQSLIGLFQKYASSKEKLGTLQVHGKKPEGSGQPSANSQKPDSISAPRAVLTNIDLKEIEAGTETRKTIMVRNIPNKLDFEEFKAFIDKTSKNCYDFLYLRFDFCNRCNVGYGFISFVRSEDVRHFVQKRAGLKWSEYNFNSEKVIDIRFALVQGRNNLIEKFRSSPVMSQDPAFRPRFYFTSGDLAGMEQPFPIIHDSQRTSK